MAAIDRMTKPFISIIVAAYNVGDYIGECLRSILVEQAYTDFELIVVNDGSTDGTKDIIDRYASDKRVRIVDQANGGLSNARNTGLALALGTYIFFVDGDDLLVSNGLKLCANLLSRESDIDILIFDWYEISTNSKKIRVSMATTPFWEVPHASWNKIFHNSMWEHERFSEGIWYEDLAIVPYILSIATKIRKLDVPVYQYRTDRGGSIMNSRDLERIKGIAASAELCGKRISASLAAKESTNHPNIDDEWKSKFFTLKMFLDCAMVRSLDIEDRKVRKEFISWCVNRYAEYGNLSYRSLFSKAGVSGFLGSFCYRHRAYFLGDVFWRVPRRIKRRFTR
jgi:glycosyltransferase involved in cell wall biosynthesis